MNFETPSDPRQALEPSLTALLLGELPEEQARFLLQAIATDPELARTFERLKSTTALLNQLNSDQGLTGSAAPNRTPPLRVARP